MSEYITNLKDATAAMHGCRCEHSGSSRVIEYFENQKVFDGNVETFNLISHPKAKIAFAWAFLDAGEPRYIAVLKMPPIETPSDAVRAAIASKQF